MSLLLEALKKAELAKQAAKDQLPPADKPPFTRDQLPDITQPMEIHSEELSLAESAQAPKRQDKPALELALEEAAPAAPSPQRAAAIETDFTPDEPEERKQAQQLFEAKEMDVNPRKPFYITVGALVLFGIGTAVYFWYQLQPRNNYKTPPPSAQSAAPPVAAAPPVEPVAPAITTVAPPMGTQPALTGPVASAPGKAPAATTAAPGPAEARGPSLLRPTPQASTAASKPRGARRDGGITIKPAELQTDPVLESAYQAFNAGDLTRARSDYQQSLRSNPDNRDALLGLAAVEMQARRYDAAESFYNRLLELDPRDAYAQAALIGLKGQVDPVTAESRVKNMIAAQPEVSLLHFTLGNQYAAQGRWAEAQQSYFQAYSSDPEHPDFAYNLAVSLDKLHQIKPALEYYRRALSLAEGRPVSFDKEQVGKRVSQLAR